MRADLFADGARDRVILGYDDGLYSTVLSARYVADVIVQAANDWTVSEWLEADSRLYGLVLVSASTPHVAADEIRRLGANERIVGVAIGGNGLSRPFGHPAYHPIYEAASEYGLPIILQAGPSDAFGDAPTSPVAGGYASTMAEYRALMWHSHCVHMSSMLIEGVFSTFPRLKVVLANGGASWLGGHLLRLDYWYRMSRGEARWLDRLPSEYVADHVRLVTYGLERPTAPALLARALETIPGIERMLLYGSSYPNRDWEPPNVVTDLLPREWHGRILSTNALETFRWPVPTDSRNQPTPVGAR